MSIFLWTIFGLFAFEVVCKLTTLAARTTYTPTPLTMALDVLVNVALMVWTAILLSSL